MMIFKSTIAAILISIAISTQVSATTLVERFTNGNYTLNVAYDGASGDINGNYNITGFSGTIGGMPITNINLGPNPKINLDDPSNPYFSGPPATFSSGGMNYQINLNRFNDLSNGTGGPLSLPEPSAWAMMLIGAGGIGAVMRTARVRRLANPGGAVA